jgi:hypothetical protein
MHVPVHTAKLFRNPHSSRVVRIHAQKEIEVAVVNRGQVMPDHVTDHFRFLPAGHEDSDSALNFLGAQSRFNPPISAAKPVRHADEKRNQVVNTARQQSDGQHA